MGRIKGKVAIVTGGAAGIGQAIALRLAGEGARVVITDIDEDLGKATAEQAEGEATFMFQDVAEEDGWEKIIADTVATYGGLDVLVNNAGVGSPAVNPEEASLEDWRRAQSINLEGTFLGCKHAMAVMREGGGGSIVNISSVAAFLATANDLVYGTSKAGVRQLTKSLALHCARNGFGIRINSVHPGAIKTAGVEARRSPEILRQVEQSIPMGHMGTPGDIADAVLFLASDESKYITGLAMIVDGGYVLAPVLPSAPDSK